MKNPLKPSVLMSLLLTVFLTIVSCRDDVSPVYNIYNEWQWVMTTSFRGGSITAMELDSTFYYSFFQNGKLVLKNINKEVVNELDIEFSTGDDFNTYRILSNDDLYGYRISSDTLGIWLVNSLWSPYVTFKISR
ncbi:MAG: hypothetical protein JJU28_22455 [Cyclobacteriaceae bacterium]|nr:hypothetical protein [Cyclobacteriaceae bacterium]